MILREYTTSNFAKVRFKLYSEASDTTDTEPGHYYWRHGGLSNVSSVEEAVEDIIADSGAKSTEVKASTDCVLGETVAKSKSPKYLPKFLRTSFSKLISKSTDKTKSQSSSQEPLSLPFFSSVSVPSLSSPTASQVVPQID